MMPAKYPTAVMFLVTLIAAFWTCSSTGAAVLPLGAPPAVEDFKAGQSLKATYRGLAAGQVRGKVCHVDPQGRLLVLKEAGGDLRGVEPSAASAMVRQLPAGKGARRFKEWDVAVGDEVELTVVAVDDRVMAGTVTSSDRYTVTLKLGDGKSVLLDKGRVDVAPTGGTSKGKVQGDPKRPGQAAQTPSQGQSKRSTGTGPDSEPASEVDGGRTKKKVFLLPLKDTVGVELRAKEMEKIRQVANQEKNRTGLPCVVILHLDSPGGLVLETPAIEKALLGIRDDGHRLVAWIRYATSGGAFTAMYAPEIYFETGGTMGSITMITNGPDGPKHVQEDAEAWEAKLAECMEKANVEARPGIIGRAMAHRADLLSYDRDPETGKVTWYDTLEGEFDLSDAQENLNFNAAEAEHCDFSLGTADSKADLLEKMKLKADDVEWSDEGERLHEKWMNTVKQCKEECEELMRDLQFGGEGEGSAEAVLRARIKALDRLIEWWSKAEEVMRYKLNAPERENLTRQRDALKLDLQQLSKQRNGAGN